VKLPHVPRPNMKICVIGYAVHIEEAQKLGLATMSVDGLKKFNKNKTNTTLKQLHLHKTSKTSQTKNKNLNLKPQNIMKKRNNMRKWMFKRIKK